MKLRSCRPECGSLAYGLTQTLVSVARVNRGIGLTAAWPSYSVEPTARAVSRSFCDVTDGVALAIASVGACGVVKVADAGSCLALPPAWQAQHGGDGIRAADGLCFSLRITLRWW